MDCNSAREAISAAFDGEAFDGEAAELELHLESCRGCVEWRERAHTVTRRARIAVAPTAPAAPQSLIEAVVASAANRPWQQVSSLTKARLGLAAVAVLQLAITVPPLILGSDRDAPIHIAHEMGAFDLALAIGFLAAAWRPVHAKGMHVLAGAAALLLVGTAVVDIAAGRTTPAAEVPHLLAVAGWILLRLVARMPARDTGAAATPLQLLRRWRTASGESIALGRLTSGVRGDAIDVDATLPVPARRAAGQ
jgi:predicted anti-sigma-YlaC factor YlaD